MTPERTVDVVPAAAPPAASAGADAPAAPRVALVSMPWMSPTMPSIQLATLAALLDAEGIPSDRHELFVDWVAEIGQPLYQRLCDRGGGFVEEWLFARHGLTDGSPDARLEEFLRVAPPVLEPAPLQEGVLRALSAVALAFVERALEETDWSAYDVVGFSCTIHQVAPSAALARRIRARHPQVRIVFGGAQCAGPMGCAVLRAFPEVDVVVRTEAEPVLVPLLRRLRDGGPLGDLPGVSWRDARGVQHDNAGGEVVTSRGGRAPLRFDAYLRRLERSGLAGVDVWLPFESSRGCWWGERKQCTFCGLHEIMRYRSWSGASVLDELEDWHARYGIPRFFAVDLILPLDYFNGFLPELARRDRGWSIFYEVKANLKRAQVEALAAAGVRWIQPGIESLDRDVLQRMKKGVSPLQNVQLLKWAKELDLRVTWNVIYGIPGESPDAYAAMADLARSLVHLEPPSGCSMFELHRFSPYFERPEEHGLRRRGPFPLYRHVYPVAEDVLEDLVYRHDYEYERRPEVPVGTYVAPLLEAVEAWRAASRSGAALELFETDEGTEVFDTRDGSPALAALGPDESALYAFLDEARPEKGLTGQLARACPAAAERLGEDGVARALDAWERRRWIVRRDGQALALAVNATHAARRRRRERLQTPVPYLTEAG